MASDMSLVVDGVDIARLSDEELYQHLTALGAVVGPVVGTTRKTYERKLAGLMGGSVSNYSFTDSPASESDGETDVQPTQAYIQRLTTEAPRARQRKPRPVLESSYVRDDLREDEEEEEVEERVGYDSHHSAPLYSPSPRRPLHSPSTYPSYGGEESYLSSPLSSRLGSSAPLTSPSRGPQERSPSPSLTTKDAAGGGGQIVFKLLLVLVLAVLLYFFFVAKSEKDSFASLEHMAKTAADAVGKSQAGLEGGEKRAGL
ncbi:LEM domain [Trinorchestia longiramus]|nr:LEM domain [Trinorchestia longiramus]